MCTVGFVLILALSLQSGRFQPQVTPVVARHKPVAVRLHHSQRESRYFRTCCAEMNNHKNETRQFNSQ
ncbi:hypothetical protein CEXT_708261 [Caerostris extrusa]|uniref:Secreted protein n=1 Tax=Caerostris extrusa TaxID=172846 RepID=A0AAV4Q698_CAEEX|nr:hypothetical protein CEXT_708261 [Caerostris extrusa]